MWGLPSFYKWYKESGSLSNLSSNHYRHVYIKKQISLLHQSLNECQDYDCFVK